MRLLRSVPLALLTLLVLTLGLSACVTVESDEGARPGADVVLELEIERRVAEIPYMHGVELVSNLERLAAIGQPAVPKLVKALRSDDQLSRASACWVLGVIGDRRNISAVRELLDDRETVVRYQAAASLVELGDNAGFPVLVDGLSDPSLQARYKCFETLRDITGQDFGYQHDGAPTVRNQAVVRWQEWLDGWRASAL